MTSPTVPAMCFVVGNILKQIPQVPNWTIPVVLPFAGAVFSVMLNGWNPAYIFEGMIAGAAAVGGNEASSRLIKATLNK